MFFMPVRDWERYKLNYIHDHPGQVNEPALSPPASVRQESEESVSGGNTSGDAMQEMNDDDLIQTGAGVINWVINRLPGEVHLYDKARKMKYNFCGQRAAVVE